MESMFIFLIFIFGAAIGSFLNVVICRLGTREKIARSRSRCPRCGRALRWFDLIPVFSFVALRGQCRTCHEKISWQYPLVEVATGLLFIMVVIKLFPELVEGSKFLAFDFAGPRSGNIILEALYGFFIMSFLVVIFVYDLRHYIIPDAILWPAISVSFLFRLFEILALNNWDLFMIWGLGFEVWRPLFGYLFAALAASAFFFLLVLVTRGRGMGRGDAKLAILMGLVLGWPAILVALFLAFFLGALVGAALIVAGRKTLKSQIPFGPFLAGVTILTWFFGQRLGDLYWYW